MAQPVVTRNVSLRRGLSFQTRLTRGGRRPAPPASRRIVCAYGGRVHPGSHTRMVQLSFSVHSFCQFGVSRHVASQTSPSFSAVTSALDPSSPCTSFSSLGPRRVRPFLDILGTSTEDLSPNGGGRGPSQTPLHFVQDEEDHAPETQDARHTPYGSTSRGKAHPITTPS